MKRYPEYKDSGVVYSALSEIASTVGAISRSRPMFPVGAISRSRPMFPVGAISRSRPMFPVGAISRSRPPVAE